MEVVQMIQPRGGPDVPVLEIHLQRGFHVDDVIVRINGHEVVERLAVTTDPGCGLAEVIRAEAPAGPVRVRVAIPSRGIVEDFMADAGISPFVGVTLTQAGDRLETRHTSTPFHY
jgi:hypothetical protein